MSRNYKNYYKDNKKEEVIDKPEINVEVVENVKDDEVVEDVKDDEVVEDVKDDEVVEDVKDDEVVEEIKDNEVVEEVKAKKASNIGTVSNCVRLNVRKSPSKIGTVLTIIDEGTEVEIDTDFINNSFYKIVVNNTIGYCMKEFIKID